MARGPTDALNENGEQRQPRRHAYSAEFKLQVVREALKRPASNRIKPICRLHPGIEPVQLRKWIRNLEALESAEPSAKCIPTTSRRPPNCYASGPKSVAHDTYASLLWQSALATSSLVTSSAAGGFGYAATQQLKHAPQYNTHLALATRTPLEPVASQLYAHSGPLALQAVQHQPVEEQEFAARELLLLSCSHGSDSAQSAQSAPWLFSQG